MTLTEQRHGLFFSGGAGSSGDNGADGDLDGDGVRNFDEWFADTNPQNASSFFAIAATVHDAGSGLFALSFQSSLIRDYVLEFTPNLNQSFAEVQTVEGTGGEIMLRHTSATAGGFYRIQPRIPGF